MEVVIRVTSDPSGPGVEDAARRPPSAPDCGSGSQTPLGDAQRPAAQIYPQQTGRTTPSQGNSAVGVFHSVPSEPTKTPGPVHL